MTGWSAWSLSPEGGWLGEVFPPEAAGMFDPVRCAFCGGVYDLGTVTVTGRYIDCSVWVTPCCTRSADDRGETGWKAHQDYRRLVRPPGSPHDQGQDEG